MLRNNEKPLKYSSFSVHIKFLLASLLNFEFGLRSQMLPNCYYVYLRFVSNYYRLYKVHHRRLLFLIIFIVKCCEIYRDCYRIELSIRWLRIVQLTSINNALYTYFIKYLTTLIIIMINIFYHSKYFDIIERYVDLYPFEIII